VFNGWSLVKSVVKFVMFLAWVVGCDGSWWWILSEVVSGCVVKFLCLVSDWFSVYFFKFGL